MVAWCGYSSRLALPSHQFRSLVGPLLFSRNISSSTPVCFQRFVLPVGVLLASSEHRGLLLDSELLFLSSTLSVDENHSWRRRVSSCEGWLPNYYTHVQLTVIVGTSRPDHN